MKLSLIIPMYNEQKNLPRSLPALSAYMKDTFEAGTYEVLFVNDGSKDESAETVKQFGDPTFSVLSYGENRGKGYAVRYGMTHARGALRIFTDCDLAYGTEVIGQMVEMFDASPELDGIAGSRRLHPDGYAGYTRKRKLMSRVYYLMIRFATGLKLSDSQSGLKGFRAHPAEAIFPLCTTDRFAFDLEVLMLCQRLGHRVGEMPARIIQNGESSMGSAEPFKMLRDMLKIRKKVKQICKAQKNQTASAT